MSSDPVCVADFEKYAEEFLKKEVADNFSCGGFGEFTLHDNQEAFKRLRLRPRVLRDVSDIDCSTTILGEKISFPLGISPTAGHKLAHPDGEVGSAKAASEAGTMMTLSLFSTTSLEEVAENSSGLKWLQLRVAKDGKIARNIIMRAEQHGYKAIVLTVDAAYRSKRYKAQRHGLKVIHAQPDLHLRVVDKDGKVSLMNKAELNAFVDSFVDSSSTWNVISWLKSVTHLPIIVKGILTKEDAELAVQHGVNGIWVSNHGGRQLDTVPATIEALPEVVKAVDGRCEVYMDGGVRFGSDIFKALTLGAKAVFIGRPILWGLAYQGTQGVSKVLALLKEEFEITMGLMGCTSLKDIVPEMVVHESYYYKKC